MKSASTQTRILIDAIQKLSATQTIEEIQNIVKVAAREMSEADGVTFVLRDNNQCYYVDEDAISPLWKGKRFPMETCISGWVMLNHKPTVIEDIYKDDRIPIEAYSPTFVESLAMVPIRSNDPIGAIGIYWSKKNRAGKADINSIQLLANSTATAIENITTLIRLNDTVKTLEISNKEKELTLKELKLAQKATEESELKFRKIFNYSNVGISIANTEGTILEANPEFTRIVDYSQKELMQMNIANLSHPEEFQDELKLFQQILDNERDTYRIEKRLITKTNETIWIDLAVSCIRNEKQEVELFYGMIFDITRKKIAEKRLLNTLDNMLEGCQIIGFDWKYIYLNHAAEEHNRRPKEELLGNRYMEMWPGIENTAVFGLIEDCLQNRHTHNLENKFEFPDGSVGWFELIIEPIPEGVLIQSYDITQKKQAQLDLQMSMDRLIEAQRIAKVGDIVYHLKSAKISLSQGLYELLGYKMTANLDAELVNQQIHHPEDIERISNWLDETITSGSKELKPLEYRIYKKDKEIIYVRTNGIVDYSLPDSPVVFATVQDISEQKRAELYQKMSNDILDVLNHDDDSETMVKTVVAKVQKATGIEAVGIRLREGNDYPYFHTSGFPDGFVKAERFLCTQDKKGNPIIDENGLPVLECMCGNILQRRIDLSKSFFTQGGSFKSNNTTRLLATTTDKDRLARTRNRCNSAGYESVALIPIKSGEEIIGLLQLNDHKTDMFNPETIPVFENLASNLGIALTRNKVKEALAKNEKLLKETGKIAKVGGWEYEIETDVWKWTDAVAEIHEVDENDARNKNAILNFFHGKAHQAIEQAIKDAQKNSTPFDLDLPLITQKGNHKWVRKIGVPVLKNGKVIKLSGSMQDISEQVQARINLIESEEKFSKIFKNSPEGIILSRFSNGEIIDINQAAVDILGYPYNELIGKSTHQINFWKSLDDRKNYKSQLIETGKNLNVETDFITKSGQAIKCVISSEIIEIAGEKYILRIIQDITKRKEAEIKLKEAKELAEKSDRLKTAFLQNMSHEIRTPLNGILGLTEVLVDNPDLDDKTNRTYLKFIQKNSDNLLYVVNDIIDISSLETGNFNIRLKTFETKPVLEDLYKTFHSEMDDNDCSCKLKLVAGNAGLILNSDEDRFRQIFRKLVCNSIKFTKEGTIEFGIVQIEDKAVTFFVADTGIGIPIESYDSIFDHFRQADKIKGKTNEGNGLGLTISKELVKLLNGEIWFESEVNRGTTFYFKLPFDEKIQKADFKPEKGKDEKQEQRKLQILIVEDNTVNTIVLKELLRDTDAEIMDTMLGEDAVQLVRKNQFDIILMDIRLPGISGFDAVTEIRKFNKTVNIIAQTAYAMPEDEQKAFAVGCNSFVTKPIDKNLLMDKLQIL